MSEDRLQSRVIDFLRFPMAILVALCHCKTLFGIAGGPAPTGQGVQIFLAEVLPHIAVPIFVFFSGYLFFYRTDFSMTVYGQKLKRRAISLLLPYVIWCTIGFGLAVLQGQCALTFENFLFGFWDTTAWMELPSHIHAAFPADMPLWFVRDLMVMTVLAPVVWWLIKHTGPMLPILTGVWWFSHWMANIPGLGSQIVFFYCLGAWFSIKGLNFTNAMRKWRMPVYVLAAGFMVADFLILNGRFKVSGALEYCWPVFNAYVLFGVFATIQLTAYLLSVKVDWNTSNFWITGSFFLYTVHFLYSPNMMVWLGDLLNPTTPLAHLGFYLLLCMFVISFATGLYALLYYSFPRFTSILVGGRVKK